MYNIINEVISMEDRIIDFMDKMYSEMQEGFKELKEGFNDLKEGQTRIENKLDAVVDQTADLTEFRTETGMNLNKISEQLVEIRDNLNNVEVITASNWKDIAKLKSVK